MKVIILRSLLFFSLIPSAGYSALSNFYNTTKRGLNFVQASSPLQGRFAGGTLQPAAFPISGIPAGTVIEAAYLYWVIESTTAGAGNTATLRNPDGTTTSYTGTTIGTNSEGKCWGRDKTINYRANVTASVTGTVNGTYTVSGLPRSLIGLGTTSDVDGATLVIIYSDCRAFFLGTLVIKDGIDVYNTFANRNSSQSVNIPAAPAGIMNSKTFCLMSDWQNLGAAQLVINGGTVPFVQNFWNWKDGTNPITSGQTTVGFSITQLDPVQADCYDWILVGAYYQVCSPPTLTISAAPSGCSATFTALTCGLAPLPGLTYNWSGSGGFSSSSSSPSYTYAATGTYSYSLTLTDPVTGCSVTAGPSSVTVTCPLPIELISFTGKPHGNKNILEWATASEINNDYFTIERSADGINFEEIAKNEAAGNSTGLRHYNYLDNSSTGIVYYRLKQTDFDGRFDYSSVISVSNTDIVNELKLQNIFVEDDNNHLKVKYTSAGNDPVRIRIFDVMGREIYSKTESARAAVNEISVDVSGYQKGTYFLRLSTGKDKVINSKFLKY